MTIDPDDPDYTLRWPPDLLADEIRHLVEEARSGAVADDRWEQEVEAENDGLIWPHFGGVATV